MRSDRSFVLVLVLVLGTAAPGCATVVLGPGDSQNNLDVGLISTLRNYRPGDLGFGPDTGLSRTSQSTLALALDFVADRVDFADVSSRRVFIPGFIGPTPRPEVARRADVRYFACLLAERVIEAHGELVFDRDRADADFLLFPWIQAVGGITTYREYRFYGYPLYLHEEDQRPVWVMVFLYDRAKRRLDILEGDRTWQVKIDSYVLGFIPFEWFLDF